MGLAGRLSLPGAISPVDLDESARVRFLSAAGTAPLATGGTNVSAAGPGAAGGAGSPTMHQKARGPIALVRATGLQHVHLDR